MYRHPTFYAIPDDVAAHMTEIPTTHATRRSPTSPKINGGRSAPDSTDPLCWCRHSRPRRHRRPTTSPPTARCSVTTRSIASHRLQQWVSARPELEEEAALANIALDLLGQARFLLARAGTVDGSGRTEDDYAFLRAPAAVPATCALRRDRRQRLRFAHARGCSCSAWRLAAAAGSATGISGPGAGRHRGQGRERD